MGKHANVLKNAFNPMNISRYIQGMVNDFGLKFTLLCSSNYFAVKGALNAFIISVQTAYWTEGGWSSVEYGAASLTARIPWSIKSFGGLLTDLFPIFGYEKTAYMYFYTILGAISCIVLGSFTMKKDTTNIAIPTLFYLFLNFQTAFTDLMIEGKYVDLMKNNPNNKGNVISFTYFCLTLGTIFPAATVGLMSDSELPIRVQFFVYLPFAAHGLIFLWYGCMVDDKADPSRNNRFDFVKMNKQRHMCFAALTMGIAGTGTVLIGLLGSPTADFYYNIGAALVMGVIICFTLPPLIAKVLVYVFLGMFTYLTLNSHVEFFYTLECVENGPHFDMTYYKTWVGFVSIAANILGIWLFQAILCQYKYRPIFWTSTIIRCIGSFFDIIIINRWNLVIGIPDKVMYIFGSAIVYNITYQLDYMPINLICAKVCPKSVETIMFSIAASYGNYGQTVGGFVGNFVTEAVGVKLVEGGPCNVDNLAWVVFIGHCVLPLFCIPFTFVLLPDKYVNEKFADPVFNVCKNYHYKDETPEATFNQNQTKI